MEFSILALVIGLAINTAWCISMYAIQQKEVRTGTTQKHGTKVLGTNQPFLHWQDFYCQRLGNTIGLAMLCMGFCHLTINAFIATEQWMIFITITVADAVGFTLICLGRNHKPDYGYPEIGKVSWCGLCHSIYHGINMAMATFCIWHLLIGNLQGPIMWLTMIGGAFYFITNVTDIMAGHFDPINYELR